MENEKKDNTKDMKQVKKSDDGKIAWQKVNFDWTIRDALKE